MTTQELYDHITEHMSAEDALKKMLESGLKTYENLKIGEGEEVHPVMIVVMAALDMGWNIMIPDGGDDDILRGMALGTQEYLDSLLDQDDQNCDCEK
jgi:hypothetical protein